MRVTNVHEAKTHLSRLLDQVSNGEEVVIGKAGKPIARLVPYQPPKKERRLGLLRGQIWMAEDFDELPEDILKTFYGESE
ncbi:MAG: type II toxin-antitoxin system Phd/YefM family antitoxin [Candidatus Omnitrophica bacterium]|nr:hypothetical protein [bacterium]NUN95447.1 type II toxin-antitoxin system Phd/YefM family antitoxin [Candidatus Omnitrophota bacterium]